MLFELPDDDVLYQALLDRDDAYDGQVYVCVSSTGIFCRLTCPARKPKRENCTFFRTVGECISSGFRACKRCRPLEPMAASDPVIRELLSQLENHPTYIWREADIVKLGYDPSTVRRSFKRQFGMTFLELARQRRLRDGFVSLSNGGKVIEAQQEAGFESASAFRDAFARLLGRAPGRLDTEPVLFVDWIPTPLGDMICVTDKTAMHLLEFIERRALKTELSKLDLYSKGRIGIGRTDISEQIKFELGRFFSGKSAEFQTPLVLHGSPFWKDVWNELKNIPAGQTRTYSELARLIGRPEAARAVARANGSNQIALVVPCHRVVGADGSLTGYGGGLWRKQKLLEIEQQFLR